MYRDSFDAVKDAVRSSDYVGIVHEDLLEEDLQRREFKILKLNDTALTAQNYLCYSTRHPLSPVAESVVSLLRAARDNKSQIGGRLPGARVGRPPRPACS